MTSVLETFAKSLEKKFDWRRDNNRRGGGDTTPGTSARLSLRKLATVLQIPEYRLVDIGGGAWTLRDNEL